jgi:hypothetical protein
MVYYGFATMTTYTFIATTMLFFGACWGARAVTEWTFLAVIARARDQTIFLLLAAINLPALPSILMMKEEKW